MTMPTFFEPQQHSSGSLEPMQVDADDLNEANVDWMVTDADTQKNVGNVEKEWNVDNPSIDVDTLVQGFSGVGRLHRLSFIARHCSALRVEALRTALQYCAQTFNMNLYTQLHQRLIAALADERSKSQLPDVASGSHEVDVLDQLWVEQKNKKAALKLEKLDTDLKNYKSNSIKESIRRGHDDLGDHFLDCGDLNNALKCYSRSRDYCTSGKHVISMCWNVVKVSIHLQNWTHVISYVNKAYHTPDFNEGNVKGLDCLTMKTRMHCAHGLAEMALGRYKSAAIKFLKANVDYCDIADFMSPQNVAAYGGLCALATFDRQELQSKVISSVSFKLFLELDPHLREIIFAFHESKYGQCLKLLQQLEDNLMLDLFLSSHVAKLYSMIRKRGIVQYFSPYLSADLRVMASSFNTSVSSLEDELMALILDNQIEARIDSSNKILFAQDVDQRSATFGKALEMSKAFQRRTKLLLLRSAFIKQGLVVKTDSKE